MGLIRKITTPARPRRAARRPRSSLLAASAAAMPIRNTKNSAERLSAGRKRSSTLRGDAEGRRVSWRTVPTFAAGARVTVDGLEHASAAGPCVVVSNHRSGPEPLPLNARQVPGQAGYVQMPTWACTRPEATASASAVWSRSVWSA